VSKALKSGFPNHRSCIILGATDHLPSWRVVTAVCPQGQAPPPASNSSRRGKWLPGRGLRAPPREVPGRVSHPGLLRRLWSVGSRRFGARGSPSRSSFSRSIGCLPFGVGTSCGTDHDVRAVVPQPGGGDCSFGGMVRGRRTGRAPLRRGFRQGCTALPSHRGVVAPTTLCGLVPLGSPPAGGRQVAALRSDGLAYGPGRALTAHRGVGWLATRRAR